MYLNGKIVRPIENDALKNGTVLLPSDAEEYGSEDALLKDIEDFLNSWHEPPDQRSRLLDKAYILLTYIYDILPQVPYRSYLAEYGKGKTVWLDAVGSICYRPMLMAGADTDKSMVRTMHLWRGTAIIDEADFSRSDLYSYLIKILNVGFDKVTGWYKRASEDDPFEVVSYCVYCCKLLARRARYKDSALESRCLTTIGRENVGPIPMYRNEKFRKQALHLRNKLITWRFRNYSLFKEKSQHLEDKELLEETLGSAERTKGISKRVMQMVLPLLLIGGEKIKSELIEIAQTMTDDLRAQDSKYLLELQAIEAVRGMWMADQYESEKEIDDADKGVYKRGGTPIHKFEPRISSTETGSSKFYTAPLKEISRMILKNKGAKDDDIDRKEVISISKNLRSLFEARLGFAIRIGKKNERTVLMPEEWFNKVVVEESKRRLECLNVSNVLNETPEEKKQQRLGQKKLKQVPLDEDS